MNLFDFGLFRFFSTKMDPALGNSAQAKRKNFAAKGSSKTPSNEDKSTSISAVDSSSVDPPDHIGTIDPTSSLGSSPNSAPVTPAITASPRQRGFSVHSAPVTPTNPSAPRRHSHNVPSSTFPEKRRVSQRPFSERRRTSVIVGQRSIDLMAETHPEEKGPKFVTFIIKLYKRWGYFIADHDWQAILICSLISILATVKVVLTP